jgi:hypothetical protein
MKKNYAALILVTFVFFVLTISPATAQVLSTNRVPVAVVNAFRGKFPHARSAAWKIKSDGNYEAEFTLQRREIAAKFDGAGKWIETESAISRSQLPAPTQASIAEKFKGYRIVETQTVQRWDDTRLIYEVHLERAVEIVKAQLYADGAILNQSTKKKTK